MNPKHRKLAHTIARQAALGAAHEATATLSANLGSDRATADIARDVGVAALTGAGTAVAHAAGRQVAERAVIKTVSVVGGREAGEALALAAAKATVKDLGKMGARAATRTAGRANVVASVGIGLVEQVIETKRLVTGEIDGAEYGRRAVVNGGSVAGSVGGGYAGAAIGSLICPGVGTVIGAFLGSALGGFGGEAGTRALLR